MEITFKLEWRQSEDRSDHAPDNGVHSYYLNCGNIVLGRIDIWEVIIDGNPQRNAEWYDAFYRGGHKDSVTALSDKTFRFIAASIEKQAQLYLEQLCINSGHSVNVSYSGREIVQLC